jgi:hypothetical protein
MNLDPITPLGYDPLCSSSPRNISAICIGGIHVIDKTAYLHKNANMRTSLDLPDPLFRTLKANAALQGTTLRDHVVQLIERGMQQPEPSQAKRAPKPIPAIPTFDFGALPAELMTNKGINEFLMNEEYDNYLNVMKHGRSTGAAPSDAS